MRERAALLHALRHWQPYLVGKEFTLRTDHNPNLALAKGKMKSYDTLTYEILEFMPFKMEFLNGNKMFVDALSRQSLATPKIPDVCSIDQSMPTPLLDRQIIISAQQSDKVLQQVGLLLNKVWPSSLEPEPDLKSLAKRIHMYDNILCLSLIHI